MSNNGKKPIGQIAIDTRLLVERMSKAEVGETIPYSELSAIVGRDVQFAARSNLESARHICQREYQCVFGVVRNEGLRRLNDTETINSGQSSVDHIRKTAKRTAARITTIGNPESVTQDLRLRQAAYLSLCAAFAHMGRSTSLRRLEGAIGETRKELPLGKTLEAFKG